MSCAAVGRNELCIDMESGQALYFREGAWVPGLYLS